MDVLTIPNLSAKALELINEIHKQLDMHCALTKELMGINNEHKTSKKIEAMITIYVNLN